MNKLTPSILLLACLGNVLIETRIATNEKRRTNQT